MVFGQVVIGPPGSGKTTYCNGMSQFLSLIGRKVAVINLDPANDSLPYECAVNIEDLIKLSDVMMEHALGPNGGLVYCMDYLEKNIDWLQSKLEPLLKDHYLLFDFPGQVELFFLHSNAKNVIMRLIKKLNLRLTAVHLVDAHLCSDPGKYVGALLLSLSTMLHLELPHVNVLSKIDLIENYGKLAFNLEYYTDVQDLSYLQHALGQDPRSAKYRNIDVWFRKIFLILRKSHLEKKITWRIQQLYSHIDVCQLGSDGVVWMEMLGPRWYACYRIPV
ncbi:GPN-loop GTPase QQT1-like isoform X3 [Citrus sinensis]|uniref:GPN-loop GTPase QQT1-like isoform X3 n=1 Tax=Citrus sinensis TaxID=2711 RepID=UPI0022792ACE|nr:GPN-loop GTPase QQT1-like isoform X3 [Citrus sinensis]